MATIPLERGAKVERPGLLSRLTKSGTPYFYLIPAAVVMGIITFYPLGFQIWMSFTNYGLANLRVTAPAPDFVGLSNYIKILTNDLPLQNFNFLNMLAFNLFWTFSNVIFHLVLGVLIAVVLNTDGLWGKGIYRAVFILPIVVPQIIIAAVWLNMYDPDYGAVNQRCRDFVVGLFGSPYGIRTPITLVNSPWVASSDARWRFGARISALP